MAIKSGYNESGEIFESPEEIDKNLSVSIAEQETMINWMRDEDFATVCTSDTTMQTKMDKLCKNSPEYYSLNFDNGRYKSYKVSDKGLITLRQKKREMSDEAKEAASNRFKQMWADKRSE